MYIVVLVDLIPHFSGYEWDQQEKDRAWGGRLQFLLCPDHFYFHVVFPLCVALLRGSSTIGASPPSFHLFTYTSYLYDSNFQFFRCNAYLSKCYFHF